MKNRIVVDCRMWGESFGGIGRYVKEIITRLILKRQEYYFTLICLSEVDKELTNLSILDNVKIIEIDSKIFSFSEQVNLWKKTPKCEIFWSPYINVPFFPIRAKYRIVSIHDVFHLANPQYYSTLYRYIIKIYYFMSSRLSKKVFTVSKFSKDEIGKYLGNETVLKTSVVYNGCEISTVGVNPKKLGCKYILFVGNIKPHKNLINALKAFEAIDNYSLKFVIVGKKEGFITRDIKIDSVVSSINTEFERVVFTGKISDSELWEYYAGADLLIVPSLYEGFGLPIIEGMQFKIPIVCSDIPVFREIGNKLLNYFVPTDCKSIKESMVRCLNDSEQNKIFDYPIWYTWDEIAGNYDKEIEQILANNY